MLNANKLFSYIALAVLLEAVSTHASQATGQLRFESMQYTTQVRESGSSNQVPLLTAAWKSDWETDNTLSKADLRAGTLGSTSTSYFSVPSLYFSLQSENHPWVLSLGREEQNWSELDRVWQFDFWQPVSSFDALRPFSEGLTGARAAWRKNGFEFGVWASYTYIPSQTAPVRNEDGKLESESRWFSSPSTTVDINDKETPVEYDLKVPPVEDIVSQQGSAVYVQWKPAQGFWVKGAYADKPLNTIVYRYSNKLILNDPKPVGRVQIRPFVTRHQLVSADFGFRQKNWDCGYSWLQENPDKSENQEDWQTQQLGATQAQSAQCNMKLAYWLGQPFKVSGRWLSLNGGEVYDESIDGTKTESVFGPRFRFTKAYGVGVSAAIARIQYRPVLGDLSYTFDTEQQGLLITAELKYFPNKSWGLLAGADILGVTGDEKTNTSNGFLNQQRANDRAYAGVTYVF